MRVRSIFWALGLAAAAASLQAVAATWHVDAKAAGAGDGSEAQPWPALTAAVLEKLQPGDTVLLAHGAYTVSDLAVKRGGAPGAPIVIRGAPGEYPVLSGERNGFILGEAAHVVFEHLEFADYKGQPLNLAARVKDGGSWIVVRDCIAHGGAIFVKANGKDARAHHLLIENCVAYAMADIPIFLDNLDGAIVRNCVFFDSKSVAMDPGGVSNLVVERNYVVNPYRLGALKIRWGDVERIQQPNCDGAVVRHNIFLEGGRYQLLLASANGACVYQNAFANFENLPSESGLVFMQRDAVDLDGKKPGPNRRNVLLNNIFFHAGDDARPQNYVHNALLCLDATMGAELDSQRIDHNLYFKKRGTLLIRAVDRDVEAENLKGWGPGFDTHSLIADPLWRVPLLDAGPDGYRLPEGSPAVDAGTTLTAAAGSGRGTELKVADARGFCPGLGLLDGDLVRVGAHPPVRIVARDLQAQVLTLEKELDWQDGDPVSLPYSGKAPDIGPQERDAEVPIGNEEGIRRLRLWLAKRKR